MLLVNYSLRFDSLTEPRLFRLGVIRSFWFGSAKVDSGPGPALESNAHGVGTSAMLYIVDTYSSVISNSSNGYVHQ